MSILDDIYRQYKEHLIAGDQPRDIHSELKQSMTPSQIREIWELKAEWILSNIFRERSRAHDQTVLEERVTQLNVEKQTEKQPVLVATESAKPEVFGERRVDIAELQRPESIFGSMIFVPHRDNWMTYGEMLSEDWHDLAQTYYRKADHALARSFAAQEIANQIPSGQTTQQALTEEQFINLLPEEGF